MILIDTVALSDLLESVESNETIWSSCSELIEAEISNIEKNNLVCDAESFVGFGTADSDKIIGSARLIFLTALNNRAIQCRDAGVHKLLQRIRRSLRCSESRLRIGEDTESNIETPVRRLSFADSPAMCTRSRGKPENIPHVQPKVLEYKSRKGEE